jgi:hypothetical protein
MREILVHWRKIVYSFFGLKLLAIMVLPVGLPGGDFGNWTAGASSVLQTILAGHLPALSTYGVYIGIEVVLAPFFWLWTILPVDHPNLANLVQYTPSTVTLGLLMKLPIFLSDTATLILLLRVVRQVTNSEHKSVIAGLTWFVNPFNFYMLYFFGAMDIIPIAVFLLGINFELHRGWFRFGVSTIVSGLLRLFAFVAYPFFIPLTKTKQSRATFIFGSVVPIALVVCVIYVSHDTLAAVFNIPAEQAWLLEFLGWNVLGTQFVRLSPVLVLFQLYVVARFWKSDTNVVYLASVSLLALLLGATLYGGESQHFLWVSPLLSACVAMHSEDSWIYALTFLTALMAPTVNPFYQWTPSPILFDTFLAGAFYAMKAAYLLKLNLSNFQIPRSPQLNIR